MKVSIIFFGKWKKLRKTASKASFLNLWGFDSFPRRYNRLLNQLQTEIVFSTLLNSLPLRIFSDPKGVMISDDSPLPKSGKKMQAAKKLYHNGSFFHGYELPALDYSGAAGNFPLALALKTKSSSSKLALSMQMIEKSLQILPPPRGVLFDS